MYSGTVEKWWVSGGEWWVKWWVVVVLINPSITI
jgi:hypothetical protein